MWIPKHEDILKRRSEIWSASRVSADSFQSFKKSSEILIKETKEIEKLTEMVYKSIPEKPCFKPSSTIITNPWPTVTLLATPDPRGRGPIARPQSAKKVDLSFGRVALKKKERPKSAPRERPLNPILAESVGRLAAPKKPKSSVKIKDGDIKKGSSTGSRKKQQPIEDLPSVVFKTQVRLPKKVRKRPSMVASMGGIGGGTIKEDVMPSWFAPGSGVVDTQAVFNVVNQLSNELKGHVHLKENEHIKECPPVKEWVKACSKNVIEMLEGDEMSEEENTLIFLESDKPPFPEFDAWREGNSTQATHCHGSSTRADMRAYSRCRKLYARSAEVIKFF